MYKLLKSYSTQTINEVMRTADGATIPFDPANTDYAQFKKAISEETAQLQDAEGVIMADAKAYVATLP